MKKVKIKPLYCLLTLIGVIILLGTTFIFSGFSTTAAASDESSAYDFSFEEYSITYDVSANRRMRVTEEITVHFEGKKSTGFIVDIPVNAGEQVKNVKVNEKTENGIEPVVYYVRIDDNDFISVDIGDSSRKTNETHTYVLTYTYCMTKAQEGKNILALNAVTHDHSFNISSVNVTINLPTECLWAEYYMGTGGSNNAISYGENLSTVTLSGLTLSRYNGLTVMMGFKDGVLSTYFDFTPYIFVIVVALLLLTIILLKLFVFNKTYLTPIVNFEAPFGMDPLMLGKLIDNTVNAEDVTALIFYWADKGYLKINLDDKDNPTLIRISPLPDTAPEYERIVFSGLFQKGDSVKISSLKYVFYRTFEKAKANINGMTKGLHRSWSLGISILFTLLSGFLIGLAPCVLAVTTISSSLEFFYGFVALIPALVLYGFSETIMYNRLKNRGKKNVLFFSLLALAIVVCSLIFIIIIPSSLLPIIPKLLLCVLSFTAAAASVLLISRTPEYNEKLNHIVGFRDFIKFAEKDRLEALLESDPQYFYHVLPYAQVLNVSTIWVDKFKDITVAPPTWIVSTRYNVCDFIVINHAINHSMRSMASGLVSRPSSSGHSGHGGFGGGRGGGHVGGGHGGSSFRGR